MGRAAAHTGQVIRYNDYINSAFEFSPNADKLTLDGPPPLLADKDGNYPFPKAGQFKDREYAMEPQANPFPLIQFPPEAAPEPLSPPERPKSADKEKKKAKA